MGTSKGVANSPTRTVGSTMCNWVQHAFLKQRQLGVVIPPLLPALLDVNDISPSRDIWELRMFNPPEEGRKSERDRGQIENKSRIRSE